MTTVKAANTQATTEANKHEEWFQSFIKKINDKISADKENLEAGNASAETVNFYKTLIDGDFIKMMSITRNDLSAGLAQKLVLQYLNLLVEKKISPLKIAFDFSPNKVLVWAEIKEGDEDAEMGLIRVESKVNGMFATQTGIHVDSIIVEDSDNLPVPSHYTALAV